MKIGGKAASWVNQPLQRFYFIFQLIYLLLLLFKSIDISNEYGVDVEIEVAIFFCIDNFGKYFLYILCREAVSVLYDPACFSVPKDTEI